MAVALEEVRFIAEDREVVAAVGGEVWGIGHCHAGRRAGQDTAFQPAIGLQRLEAAQYVPVDDIVKQIDAILRGVLLDAEGVGLDGAGFVRNFGDRAPARFKPG